MQNAEFIDLTQTSNFYIKDLFQKIFLTSIQPHITQEHIKAQQRVDSLVFLSSQSDSK